MSETWPTSSGVDLHLDLHLDRWPGSGPATGSEPGEGTGLGPGSGTSPGAGPGTAPRSGSGRGPGPGGRRAALERALRDAVRDGRLAPAARLPSTRHLAEELGLSRGTVKAAYDQLIAEGYLTARRGSGTVVAERPQPAAPAARRPAHPAPRPRYDLRPGSPDVTAFPAAAWLRATRRALAVAPSAAYDYGDPRGRRELRTALAEYLGRARGVLADPERIVVTSGFVQALALLVRALDPVVAMEDPGLPFHREVVRGNGGRIATLPTDERGARTDLLGARIAADAVLVTPAHQYPTGVTLHPQRRHALTAWARAGGGLVIEDDYDGEFRYDRQPVGALQGTAPERVAYVGTAAKTLAPALRLGWLVLPARLVEPVVAAKRVSDLQGDAISQLTLAELIRDHGYDRHIRASRLRYRRRRDLLVERLPAPYRASGIAAGLQALVRLPPGGPDEAEACRRAARLGLAVGTLGEHWHERTADRPQGLIIGYGTPAEGAWPPALSALTHTLAPRQGPDPRAGSRGRGPDPSGAGASAAG